MIGCDPGMGLEDRDSLEAQVCSASLDELTTPVNKRCYIRSVPHQCFLARAVNLS